MATIPKPRYVSVNDNEVSISNFTTNDKLIHGYFANLSESDDLDKKFEDALKVGVVAAKTIDTAGYVDFVETKFNVLDSSFHQKMEEIFGEGGKFSKLITEHFGEDGKLIKDYLNPNKEGSPLQLTVKEFTTRLEELKTLLGIKIGTDAAEKKSTQKGAKFEDYCLPLLEDIARMHSDEVDPTGTKDGIITDCKKGDFVYTIKELNKKIVWETKNYSTKLSRTDINLNLDVGIKNREADYGILVSKSVKALPRDMGWFKELSNNKLVCALGEQDDDELHSEILHIAYKWARSKILQDTLQNGSFDPTLVQNKITVLQEKLKKFKSIKQQCENIDGASTEIKEISATLNEEIDKGFKEILDSLK